MAEYPMFAEIINAIAARPDADPIGILEEYVGPLVDVCNEMNQWFGKNPDFDLHFEPPWYEKFIRELARFDVDLSGVLQRTAPPNNAVRAD